MLFRNRHVYRTGALESIRAVKCGVHGVVVESKEQGATSRVTRSDSALLIAIIVKFMN